MVASLWAKAPGVGMEERMWSQVFGSPSYLQKLGHGETEVAGSYRVAFRKPRQLHLSHWVCWPVAPLRWSPVLPDLSLSS